MAALRDAADAIVCLKHYAAFGAIGYYNADFSQISDEEVVELLARFPTGAPEAGEKSAVRGPV